MNRDKIEEMIKEIEKCSCVYTPCDRECGQCSNAEMYDDTINHIARTMYEAGYRKQEWISVEERLPDLEGSARTWGDLRIQPSVRVLCACKQKSGKVFVKEGYCEMWGNRVVWKIPGSIDSVTHWMPIPEAPKMKGEKNG